VAVVEKVRSNGGRVFGYVHTDSGRIKLTDVEANINTYAAWHPIDGIFVDEMYLEPNQVTAKLRDYYGPLYSYIKDNYPAYSVIGNPGANTPESYLTTPAVDVIGTFEGTASTYQNYVPDSWVENYGADHFAHLVNSAPASTWRTSLSLAVQRHAGLVYITDDAPGNPLDPNAPYGILPTYWESEVAAIAAMSTPEPSMTMLLAISFFCLLAYAGSGSRGFVARVRKFGRLRRAPG
jgi:hypothetical protein